MQPTQPITPIPAVIDENSPKAMLAEFKAAAQELLGRPPSELDVFVEGILIGLAMARNAVQEAEQEQHSADDNSSAG